MNLWGHSSQVRDFVFGKTLARIAAELLEVDGVRLYHDQSLYEEPSGGITPAHADEILLAAGERPSRYCVNPSTTRAHRDGAGKTGFPPSFKVRQRQDVAFVTRRDARTHFRRFVEKFRPSVQAASRGSQSRGDALICRQCHAPSVSFYRREPQLHRVRQPG
jgi:hypothetical protein